MRYVCFLPFVLAGALRAQTGQQGSRPEWPCVPGRPVDPAYIETSEGTGGQLFLFQKSEVAQTGLVMNAAFTHSVTIARSIGHLSGARDFEFPIDSTVESIMVLVSLQCRNAIDVSRPSGAKLTAGNSAQSVDLVAGRILRVDNPESGKWNIRIAGTGLFVLSVLAKTRINLHALRFSPANGVDGQPASGLKEPLLRTPQFLEARVSGEISRVKFQLVGAGGEPIADGEAVEATPDGAYRTTITPSVERFRILMTGIDASGWPVQRTHPVLFRATQPK